jgi:hypothetical protein
MSDSKKLHYRPRAPRAPPALARRARGGRAGASRWRDGATGVYILRRVL